MPNAHNQTAHPMVELSLAQVELIARANIFANPPLAIIKSCRIWTCCPFTTASFLCAVSTHCNGSYNIIFVTPTKFSLSHACVRDMLVVVGLLEGGGRIRRRYHSYPSWDEYIRHERSAKRHCQTLRINRQGAS